MKTRSAFWGTIFIIAGALLLLGNLGVLTINVWRLVWPSFIIATPVTTPHTAIAGRLGSAACAPAMKAARRAGSGPANQAPTSASRQRSWRTRATS